MGHVKTLCVLYNYRYASLLRTMAAFPRIFDLFVVARQSCLIEPLLCSVVHSVGVLCGARYLDTRFSDSTDR